MTRNLMSCKEVFKDSDLLGFYVFSQDSRVKQFVLISDYNGI